MLAARRIQTTVQAGGRIEVMAPDLPVGESVEVTIQSLENSSTRRSVLDILAECPGGVLFKTADEVDAYIREERDSWDR
ncbi:MAG: hypothetical protein HOP29_04710 [Phycisphaerales bacterium]|nr:hypothetical protein [Phycisphaerales bacterium]